MRDIEPRHLADVRAERLIASGRLTLSALVLLAIWLDPGEPARLPDLAYSLTALYLLYALLVAAFAWAPKPKPLRWRLATHGLDLMVYSGIIFFTNGATSPFFVYLVFALIAAALRWRWPGVLATAAAAFVAYVAIAAPAFQPSADQSILLTFMIRTTYLAVFAVLLGHLGTHYHRLRRDLDDLASWPSSLSNEPSTLAAQLLAHAANVLETRDAALLWRDREWTHFAWTRSSPAGTGERLLAASERTALIAPELADKSFIARDGRAADSAVLYFDSQGVHYWRGPALGPAPDNDLPAGPLISLALDGLSVEARLFGCRAKRFSDEDLMLGEVLTRQIVLQLDRAVEGLRDRRSAAVDERVRMARDLHDGVIQSLTGASLRLRSVDRLLEAEPREARRLLNEIDELLTSEQQELRWFLAEPRGTGDWMERLPQLLERMARNWDLAVSMEASVDDVLVGEFGHEVYRIVQESLVNAARHGRARTAVVEMTLAGERLRLVVSDDGQGFPFAGEFDDTALRSQRLGPVSIKQRVDGLGGRLHISSTAQGARLEIDLPLLVTSA